MIVVRDAEHEAYSDTDRAWLHNDQAELSTSSRDPGKFDNPDHVVADVYADWAPPDNAASVSANPEANNEQLLFLLPNSFACLPLVPVSGKDDEAAHEAQFNSYGNIHRPLERALVESFVEYVLPLDNPEQNRWGASLMSCIWIMIR
jgi:hypothetical protein